MKIDHKGYRIFLWSFLGTALAALAVVWGVTLYYQVPKTIKLKAGEEQLVDFHAPVSGVLYKEAAVPVSGLAEGTLPEEGPSLEGVGLTDEGAISEKESIPIRLGQKVVFKAGGIDNYTLDLKLFGILPFKQIDVEVIQDKQLTPVGVPIGIYVRTRGVLVIATGDFTGNDGQKKEPSSYVLKEGDYILQADGQEVESKADFMNRVAKSGGEEMLLTIRREDAVFDVSVTPQTNQYGEYKLGLWVRDNAQGVGTLTYIDEDNHFGALGHGINDMDTAQLMDLKSGSLYETQIVSIKKGEDGVPGELTGIIAYNEDNRLGSIEENTKEGIFGTLKEAIPEDELLPPMKIGLKQEVSLGPAQILSAVNGEQKLYNVEITQIHLDNDNINRGIELKITDPELLSLTGGIVQGMSGSPIIQDGKLIGAITHVLVAQPDKGYGIFIENMLLMR